MEVIALVSFAGAVSMHKGEVRELNDQAAVPLLKAGYVEATEAAQAPAKRKRKVSADENP